MVKSRKILAVHHTLFEVIVPINLMVTTVYWSLLSESVLAMHANNPAFYLNSVLVHSVPLVATIANFCVTDIVFKPSHCLGYVPIGFLYCSLNYYATVTSGKPVYWFLDWQDYKSVLICASLLTSVIAFFLFMSRFTQSVRKYRPSHKGDSSHKVNKVKWTKNSLSYFAVKLKPRNILSFNATFKLSK